jgi:hypothetical protein
MRKSYMKMLCVLELSIFVLMMGCNSKVERASKQVDLSDKWSGFESEWGWVTIEGNRGTYTATHGPNLGSSHFIGPEITPTEVPGANRTSDNMGLCLLRL